MTSMCCCCLINQPEQPNAELDVIGGLNDSGLGRDGVRYAMEEMTKMRHILVGT
ncbi:MAG: hypothetical protein R3E01_35465 [Pirellulaceae bacterium]|nr:hypothetical protein [Planctomycetales bacterium]